QAPPCGMCLGNKRPKAPPIGRLARRRGFEFVRRRVTGDVGGASRIRRYAITYVFAAPAEVGGIDQLRPVGAELRDERFGAAPAGRLERVPRVEVGRGRVAGDVSGAGRIHRDPVCGVISAAAEIGRVNYGVAVCAEFCDKGVSAPLVHDLRGAFGWKVGGGCYSGDIGGALAIYLDALTYIVSAATQVSRIFQRRVNYQRLRRV